MEAASRQTSKVNIVHGDSSEVLHSSSVEEDLTRVATKNEIHIRERTTVSRPKSPEQGEDVGTSVD
ncbi:hypothetical protein KIN20_014394 [Parelaphostrongylus tenuis]|uniref:Uncharacterized protein n=1 Tax=Parelaphostrongylus tenuis TaxID=148309 RepID=A0AAD5MZ42_PARTN|nr:hypothetical protein KIN20_014394 [Parelaphostrongylus tenuis]